MLWLRVSFFLYWLSFGDFLENFTVLVCFYGVWFGFLLLSVSVLLSCPPLLLSATWVTFLLFPCVFVSFFLLRLQFVCFFYLHRPSDFALSSCDWKQQQYFSTKQIKLTNLKGFFLIMSNIIYPVFCPMWFLFSQNMQIKDINFCFQITREIFLYFLMC